MKQVSLSDKEINKTGALPLLLAVLMLHNRSQPPNLHLFVVVVVVLTIMSVSQTTQHRW